jgi:hypothetical protein
MIRARDTSIVPAHPQLLHGLLSSVPAVAMAAFYHYSSFHKSSSFRVACSMDDSRPPQPEKKKRTVFSAGAKAANPVFHQAAIHLRKKPARRTPPRYRSARSSR